MWVRFSNQRRRMALLHDSTAARVGALFQLLVQDTTAQDFGLPSSAIRLRMAREYQRNEESG